MASQNMDPAAAAASSTAALKGSESGGSAARGSVSKRWEPDYEYSDVILWSDSSIQMVWAGTAIYYIVHETETFLKCAPDRC